MIRMTLTSLIAVALAMLVMLPGGCSRGEGTAPPTVHYGEDVCALCGMIVSDERFAAAVVAPGDGERFIALYDDIGDMLADEQAISRPGAVLWVHDFNTSAWLDARSASYCADSALVTPMASGIAAFATRDEATAIAEQYSGKVVDFAGLTPGR